MRWPYVPGGGQARDLGRQHVLYLAPDPHQRSWLRAGGHARVRPRSGAATPVEIGRVDLEDVIAQRILDSARFDQCGQFSDSA